MNKKNVYLFWSSFFIIGIIILSVMMYQSHDMNEDSMIQEEDVSISNEIINNENGNSLNEEISESIEENSENMANTKVKFTTNYGDFVVELYTQKSPITAGNFEELVAQGFYDGTKFHRVIDGFMIQGGDPQSKEDSLMARWGTGGPGYTIEDEFITGTSNVKGTLSMANSGPQSGGSQFFINVADNTFLDFDKQPLSSKHPVFGEVVEGMDIVLKISQVQTQGPDRPVENVVIEKVEIIN